MATVHRPLNNTFLFPLLVGLLGHRDFLTGMNRTQWLWIATTSFCTPQTLTSFLIPFLGQSDAGRSWRHIRVPAGIRCSWFCLIRTEVTGLNRGENKILRRDGRSRQPAKHRQLAYVSHCVG